MKGNFSTKLGKVEINNSVIARLAGIAALECFGIVGMSALSTSDGVIKLLTRNSIAKGIKINVDNNEVSLEFHVIVAYGVSIPTVAQNLIENVQYQVEQSTGFKVKKINIIVDGVRVID